MKSELKPCPFCGSKELRFFSEKIPTGYSMKRISRTIQCEKCGATGGWTDTKDLSIDEVRQKVISAWNTRAHAQAECDRRNEEEETTK